jgi:hypothetical protein
VPAIASPPVRASVQKVQMAVADPPLLSATLARSYDTFDANQAVAADRKHFYVVDDRSFERWPTWAFLTVPV